MRFKPSHLLVLSALLLEACAGVPAYEGLPPAARDQISSTEVVVPIQQHEIYVYVPPETAGASQGLIGALIDVTVDAVRAGKAERAVRPLRDATVDYNFDTVLQNDVKTELTHLAWLNVDNVRVVKDSTDSYLNSQLGASKDAAVLMTAADYQLSNDGDVLTVTLKTGLFPKSDALKALQTRKSSTADVSLKNALYHDTLSFTYRLPTASADRDHNISEWSVDHGTRLKHALDASAGKLAWLLSQDIQSSIAATPGLIPNSDPYGTLSRAQNGTLTFTANYVGQ